MNDAEWPDYPRFMIAAARKVSTIRSPKDGQEGLAAFWTKAAAKKVARLKPGTVVVEATPEMFVEALRKANGMGVPWLYIGTELGSGVDFQRVRLAVILKQYARGGQHRHGENEMEVWIDPHSERNQQRIVWEEDPYFITEKVWQDKDSITGEVVNVRRFYIRQRLRRNRIGQSFRSVEDALAYLVRNERIDDDNSDFEKCGLRRPRPRKR